MLYYLQNITITHKGSSNINNNIKIIKHNIFIL